MHARKEVLARILTMAAVASLFAVTSSGTARAADAPSGKLPVPPAAKAVNSVADLENDAAWNGAANIDRFANAVDGGAVLSKTHCQFMRTPAALAVRCKGSGEAPPNEPNEADIMKGDYFAIALYAGRIKGQPAQRVFILNPSNVRTAHGIDVFAWNPAWQSAVAKSPVGWTAYLLLPIGSLASAGQPRIEWRAAILRSNRATGEVEVWPYVAGQQPLTYDASAELTGLQSP